MARISWKSFFPDAQGGCPLERLDYGNVSGNLVTGHPRFTPFDEVEWVKCGTGDKFNEYFEVLFSDFSLHADYGTLLNRWV